MEGECYHLVIMWLNNTNSSLVPSILFSQNQNCLFVISDALYPYWHNKWFCATNTWMMAARAFRDYKCLCYLWGRKISLSFFVHGTKRSCLNVSHVMNWWECPLVDSRSSLRAFWLLKELRTASNITIQTASSLCFSSPRPSRSDNHHLRQNVEIIVAGLLLTTSNPFTSVKISNESHSTCLIY